MIFKHLLLAVTIISSFHLVEPEETYANRRGRLTRKRENVDEVLKKFADLIDDGVGSVEYFDGDVIIIWGNIGSGKTTLTQYLVEDNSELTSLRNKRGEFIIQDSDNKISSSPDKPKTIFPEVYFDTESNQVYYDFPGFDPDDRLLEISEAYFIEQIWHYAEKLKIIFTVDSADLKNNLEVLLNSAINHLRNYDRYTKSIALVVTKVENTFKDINGIEVVRDDDEVIESVAEALITLGNETVSDPDALKLIEIFLQSENGKYTNIGLFRKPNDVDTLDKINLVQNGKPRLYSLIENLQYIEKNANDFVYEPSEKAYDTIIRLHTKSKSNINSNMTDVLDEIEKFHDVKLKNTRNILDTLKHDIIPTMSNLKNCINFDHFDFTNILNCVSEYQPDVNSLSNNFLDSATSIVHKKILEKVARDTIDGDETSEINALTKIELTITENIVDYVVWESIYSSVLDKLETYEKHKNASTSTDILLLTGNNEDLINILTNEYNISQNFALSKTLDRPKLEVLNKILKVMTSGMSYECRSPGILTVKGVFIVTSQINITNKCKEPVTYLEIFAMSKIFLDSIPSDISNIDVAVISPNLDQVNFNLMQHISLHKSKNFWILSYMDIMGIGKEFYFYVKPCAGRITSCYNRSFAHSINMYKRYVVGNSIIQRNEDMKFFKTLNKNSWAFLNIYDTSGFIDEFINLEEEIQQAEDKTDLLPVYTSLLDRIKDYSQHPNSDETGIEYKKALKYLYTATLTRICNIKNSLDNNLIINNREYLKQVIKYIKEFKEKSEKETINKLIHKYKNEYDEEINSKIDEGIDFVDNYLSKEIDELINKANDQIPLLLQELLNYEDRIEEDINYLNKKSSELKDIIARKAILGIISIFSKILYLFGAFGVLASTAIDTGIGVINELSPNGIDFNRELTQLPPGVEAALQENKLKLDKIEDVRIEALDNKLYVVLHYLQESPNSFPSSASVFRAIKFELRRIKYKKGSIDRIDQLTEEFNQELKNIEQYSLRFRRKITETILIDKMQTGLEVVKMGRGLFDGLKSDSEKLHKMAEAIENSKHQLQDLHRYEDKLFQLVKPTLNNLRSYIDDLKNDASVQSEIGILVSKWEMQDVMKDVKLELQKLTKGFSVENSLAICIEKIYEAVSTILDIFKRIQQYGDNKQLVDLISNIALTSNNGMNNDDSEISKSINKLDKMIEKNVILNQYDRIIDSFKQYAFPFADFFIGNFKLPKSLENNNTNQVIDDILSRLEDLESKFSISLITINPNIDRIVQHTGFYSNYTTTKPFYVWKNNQYKDVIAKLLSGQEIVLKADVMKNGHNKNAIKFNKIGINVRAIKKSLQDELDEVLKQFGVVMTHMGNSYYRCDDKYYVIRSQSQEISYTFEKQLNGEPVETNEVYDKIANGDISLSPYSLWKIKLKSNLGVSFEMLRKFENRINLELVGYGIYVDMNSDVCMMNLESYYSLENPVYDEVNILPVY